MFQYVKLPYKIILIKMASDATKSHIFQRLFSIKILTKLSYCAVRDVIINYKNKNETTEFFWIWIVTDRAPSSLPTVTISINSSMSKSSNASLSVDQMNLLLNQQHQEIVVQKSRTKILWHGGSNSYFLFLGSAYLRRFVSADCVAFFEKRCPYPCIHGILIPSIQACKS